MATPPKRNASQAYDSLTSWAEDGSFLIVIDLSGNFASIILRGAIDSGIPRFMIREAYLLPTSKNEPKGMMRVES